MKIPEIIDDIKNDPRLSKLNAIVFLALKQKGRGKTFNPIPFHKFKEMIEYVMESGISYGFDSCSCTNFLKAVQDHPKYEQFKTMSEPCESTAFSSYIDVHGKFAPCSFCEGIVGWEEGLDVVNCKNFLQDIWNHPKTVDFRESLLANGRSCPIYKI
jgi:MoaA/NifB/PqqE/SkfB family radical SAM enzyme